MTLSQVCKYYGYGKPSCLNLQGQIMEAAISSETSEPIDPFTWLHIPEGPDRTWHSDLTDTLSPDRGSSCYEHTLTLALYQTLWSSNTRSSYSARRLQIFTENSCFYQSLRQIWGQCSNVCHNFYLPNPFPYHSKPCSMTDWYCCSIYHGCQHITVFLFVK
jgi:hypothetical protein